MKITKAQIRQIIKEEIQNVKKSIMLTEVFKSDVLRNLASGYGGLNREFFSQTAKRYGVEWDKIEDYHIEKLRTPKKKGLVIAVAGKSVEYLPSKVRQGYYSSGRAYVGLTKGRLVAVLKDGKALYTGSSYRAEIGTAGEVDSYSKRMVGLDVFGYRSLKAIQDIPGLEYYHIDMKKGGEFMRAQRKAELRSAARYGASKFTDHKEFAKQQKQRYSDLVQKMKNDPKKIKTMVNKTIKHFDKMMKEVMDLKSPTMKKYIKIIQKEYGAHASDKLDSNQFKAASELSQRSSRLYEKYSYYLRESNKGDKSDALSSYVDSYAADVVNDCRSILGMKAIDYIRYY